jgi:hypothetical protein
MAKSKDWSIKDWEKRGIERLDRHDGIDPQIAERFFVSFDDETHGYLESSDEVETPEPDQSKLMAAMRTTFEDVLTRQERYVLTQHLVGDTYATIAAEARPRISSASQTRKIEQRALRKMRVRLDKFLKPKPDTSDV